MNEVGASRPTRCGTSAGASLLTLAAMWATIAVVLTVLVGRLYDAARGRCRATRAGRQPVTPVAIAGPPGCCSASPRTWCSRIRGAATRSPASAPSAARLERRWWRDDRRSGVAYVAALVGGAVVLGLVAERPAGRCRTLLSPLLATWAVLGGTSLDREGAAIQRLLDAGHARRGARSSSPTWSAGTPRSCRSRRSSGPPSSRWPRTPPTRSSLPSCGAPSPASRGCSAIARPTPSTRWSATGRPATNGSAGPRPGSTTCSTSRARGSPRRSPSLLGDDRRRCVARLAPRRGRPPQPQRRPGRGVVRRRAGHPARRHQHLRRPRRAPRGHGRRPGPGSRRPGPRPAAGPTGRRCSGARRGPRPRSGGTHLPAEQPVDARHGPRSWVNVPDSAISVAAARNPPHAVFASAPPVVIRRTPSSAASATVMNGA